MYDKFNECLQIFYSDKLSSEEFLSLVLKYNKILYKLYKEQECII